MKKICIVGGPGAGKSTLARDLAQRTELPVVHLDQHYWQAGWQAPALDEEWRASHRRLIAGDRWIVDGSYLSTLAERIEACDTVVHVDLPRWLCLLRVLKRVATSYGRVRPDMSAGCPERLDWDFLGYIWRFRDSYRPRLLRALDQWQGHRQIVTLRSPAQIRAWLATVGEPTSETNDYWQATSEHAGA